MSRTLIRATVVALLVVSSSSALTGCQANTQKELERVAKDWCMTIRASQVIPVYPLTEDLQPGDVFLVQTPISQQAAVYREKGFLPLDQLVTRLDGLEYAGFYEDAYWQAAYADVPNERPESTAERTPGEDDTGAAIGDDERHPLGRFKAVKAPRAAFPSYTFSVESGAGLQLAIPVQGVPVGLGLMGASRATGSVTISDAYTYGIDTEGALRALRAWAIEPEVARELSNLARSNGENLYLRVVNRVFLTGAVVVSMNNLDALSAGADAGAAKPIELLDLAAEDPDNFEASANAYKAALAALSDPLNEGGPGGSFRFAQASQRAVTLKERFDRPLVIGYVGFDVPVLESGALGTPLTTSAVLTKSAPLPPREAIPVEVPVDGETSSADLSKLMQRDTATLEMIRAILQENGIEKDPADLLFTRADRWLRMYIIAEVERRSAAPTEPTDPADPA
jgi:hypothetical protein